MCLLLVHSEIVAQTGAATCAGATSLTVNGSCGFGSTVGGAISAGSTASVCGVAVQGDRWFAFTTLNTTAPVTITASAFGGTGKNIAIQIVSACPATTVGCVNSFIGGTPEIETISLSLSPLTTYFIRIVNLSLTPGAAMNYNNVCVTQPPEDDEPMGATEITVDAGLCNPVSFDNTLYTSSSCAPAPTCGNFVAGSSVDVWCKLTVPTSGEFFLQTNGAYIGPGSGYDNFAMAVYSSSVCGSATILGCSDGNPNGIIDPITGLPYVDPPMSMPTLFITGASPGSTVYIRIWNEDGSLPGYFDICAHDMGPCGNPVDNDFCSNPASVSFSGATAGSVATNTLTGIAYTYDEAGDINVAADNAGACIYPGNNSWYSFIANAADAGGLTIPFTLDGAVCAIEAVIYEISRTSNGCCENFEQLSDCAGVSGGNNSFNVTVPPGVLVPGNTYNLMINNSDPSACSFTITGWSATGVLPVELVSFTANNEGKRNVLQWITSNEQNMLSYELEHSEDAVNFSLVASMKAKGMVTSNTKYEVFDENPFQDLSYYRIKQIENSGAFKYSNVISINLKNLYDNIYNIKPNPTSNSLNFEFYAESIINIDIELLGYAGNVMLKQTQRVDEGKNKITLPMSELDNGVYILKVVSEKSGKTTHYKIIKN